MLEKVEEIIEVCVDAIYNSLVVNKTITQPSTFISILEMMTKLKDKEDNKNILEELINKAGNTCEKHKKVEDVIKID